MDRRGFIAAGGVATLSLIGLARSPEAAAAPVASGGYYDITSFGAIGDAVTDNTSAIQRAINAALAAGGGKVWVPAGVFMTSGLVLPGGITIQGAGWQSILKLRNSANTDLISTPRVKTNYYGGVEDICLDGNRAQNTKGSALSLFAATNFHIAHVKISKFAGNGIVFSGSSSAWTIAPWVTDCGIYDCGGDGLTTTGNTSDCKIHAVDIGRCSKGIVLPNSSFLSDVTIWQCVTGLYGYWAANANLVQVRVERSRNHGFLFEGCTDIAVESCRAYENNQSAGNYDGFAFRGTAQHPCLRINLVGCLSGLVGSQFEKQRYGFSDGGSPYVDYLLSTGCTALGNRLSGYDLSGGTHDVSGVNL